MVILEKNSGISRLGHVLDWDDIRLYYFLASNSIYLK